MLVVGALKRPWRCRTDMVRQRSHAVRYAGQVTAERWHHDAGSCTCVNAVRSTSWGLFSLLEAGRAATAATPEGRKLRERAALACLELPPFLRAVLSR